MLALRSVCVFSNLRGARRLCTTSGNQTLFVSNIPWAASQEDVTELFNTYGQVTDVRLILDKETRRPKGFGFVTFADPQHAASAVQTLNGTEFQGRTIRVAEANRPTRSGDIAE
eukprot:TRINITY_DN7855_c0_g2_i2.p1 TRINITY_DN7855_c0_g2~~TRINITY_DN7855_c0_g2_i2.p1  ORF type:complete len:114 (-),score=11.57 TRINITY_DN7855_c0_g2_i2:105-446(-)